MAAIFQRMLLLISVLLVTSALWGPSGRVGVGVVKAVSQADLYRLMNDLFNDYKLEVRPTTAGEATYVFAGVFLLSIQNLDEKEQVLETSIILEAEWNDDYLSWNKSEYGNLTYFLYPQEKIWLPDVIIENSVETQKQMGYDDNKVRINRDGWVVWKPSQIIKTSCDIDVTYYPFDTQTCNIIISTWMSGRDEIDIDPDRDSNGLNLDRYSNSGTWELLSNELQLLPDSGETTRIQFQLKLKRLRTFYIVNIILPVLFLSFTASMVFFLPAEAGEKIGMGITVLLAFAVYLTIISDNMPQTSLQVSYLAVYLTLLLGTTAMGVVLAVVVLHLHHKPEDRPVGSRTTAVVRRVRTLLCIQSQKPDSWDHLPANSVKPVDCEEAPVQNGHGKNTTSSGLGKISTASRPRTEHQAFSPPPSYKHGKEEITWPKVAETVDRVLFFFTSFFIALITIVFLTILAVGD